MAVKISLKLVHTWFQVSVNRNHQTLRWYMRKVLNTWDFEKFSLVNNSDKIEVSPQRLRILGRKLQKHTIIIKNVLDRAFFWMKNDYSEFQGAHASRKASTHIEK